MTDPNETADLVAQLLGAYREHAAADAAAATDNDAGEDQAEEDDPDCE
jgi:hypothetical protein